MSKSRVMHTRVSEETRSRILRVCLKQKRKMSDWCRLALEQALEAAEAALRKRIG